MNNWLAKLASEQPTNESNFQQALEELPMEDLQQISQEVTTPHLDDFQEKVAQADEMGRAVARSNPELAGIAEQEAIADAEVAEAIQALPEEEAIKLAYVLENGNDMEKEAFLRQALTMGKNLASKAMGSGAGRKVMNKAVQNPLAATTVAGAGAGAIAGGEGNRLTGALGGAALGAGAGKMIGKGQIRRQVGKASAWGKRRAVGARPSGMSGPMKPNGLFKGASIARAINAILNKDMQKMAYMEDGKNEWLEQFEGSPLMSQAIDMSKQEVETEILSIQERAQKEQQRKQERAAEDGGDGMDSYDKKSMLRAQKKLLELQLVAQRNGIQDPDIEAPGQEAPMEEAPQPGMEAPQEAAPPDEGPAMAPEAQEQVKMAYAQALLKIAEVDKGDRKKAIRTTLNQMQGSTPRKRAKILGAIGAMGGATMGAISMGRGARIPGVIAGGLGGGLGGYAGSRLGDAAGGAMVGGLEKHWDPKFKKKYNKNLAAIQAGNKEKTAAPPIPGTAAHYAKKMFTTKGSKFIQKSTPPPTPAAALRPKVASKGMMAAKALAGMGAVGGAGYVGHKKGKSTGRREGFRYGVGKGYNVGARRGFRAGAQAQHQSHMKSHHSPKPKATEKSKKAMIAPHAQSVAQGGPAGALPHADQLGSKLRRSAVTKLASFN